MSNDYPAIPDPQNNVESLADAVRALKMAVETLAGQRSGGAAVRVFNQATQPSNPRGGDIWLVSNDAGTMRIWNGHYWYDISNIGSGGGSGTATSLSDTALATITDTINPELEALKAQADAALAQTAKVTKELNKQIDLARSDFQDAIDASYGKTVVDVQNSSANSFAQVQSEAAARVTNDSAIAGYVTKVSAGASGVYVQDDTPTGMSTGATWLKPAENYKPYYYNGSSWLDNSSGSYPIGKVADLQAQVTNETYARTTGDSALATYITRSSVGSGAVYVQGSAPSSPAVGAIWYSTANSNDMYHPYYWDGGSWLDNSAGTYGNVATISSSLSTVQNKVNNVLGVQWAVTANINNTTGGLSFTGIKKADGSGATYTFEIDAAWTKINGNCLVTGSIAATALAVSTLSSITANIGTITAGKMQSSDTKFIIDLDNRNITISD